MYSSWTKLLHHLVDMVNILLYTLPETNSSHLPGCAIPGNNRLPTIHLVSGANFLLVSGRVSRLVRESPQNSSNSGLGSIGKFAQHHGKLCFFKHPESLSVLKLSANSQTVKHHGNLRVPTPPMPPFPQEIAGLIFRDDENPLVSLNKAGCFWPAKTLGGKPT